MYPYSFWLKLGAIVVIWLCCYAFGCHTPMPAPASIPGAVSGPRAGSPRACRPTVDLVLDTPRGESVPTTPRNPVLSDELAECFRYHSPGMAQAEEQPEWQLQLVHVLEEHRARKS